MELRQLRYFVSIVDFGGMGKAALALGVATAALSQQISRLEAELGVRLLLRQPNGTTPTEAGAAFYRRAQLVLRHADDAVCEAKRVRLTGAVSVGLTPATAALLGTPFFSAMHERYPEVRLHLVECFSGFLSQMLNARQIDLAVLFQTDAASRWNSAPLLRESLFAICSPSSPHAFSGGSIELADLAKAPLILPSRAHGLRVMLDAAFAQQGLSPHVVAEIDSLGMLMESVRLGHGITVQQSGVAARPPITGLSFARLSDAGIAIQSLVVSLSADELSPAAHTARAMIHEVATKLVQDGRWIGATLSNA